MKVHDSSTWVLNHYIKHQSIKKTFAPLLEKRPEKSLDEWFRFLYEQGLLPVEKETKKAWFDWHKRVNKKELERFIKKMKTIFQGPDTDIIIFPLNMKHGIILEELDGKNGIAFPGFILAFWKETLPEIDQKALLLHEYHHASRLFHRGENERSISLLESMIMEGLAEWEVANHLGEDHMAPWAKNYDRNMLLVWWKKVYHQYILLQGRHTYKSLLFGGERHIPPLTGYKLGYDIVKTHLSNNEATLDSLTLLKKAPETFLTGPYKMNEGLH
ncbi:DUF2268 domain-containing protein [Salipaludibacillus sp. LMS25]|uniref:DUF2268 domain-containing putative Zn-dependent protease n=1 Tax=Salipaludibacillus sp. LMS25 TaxID=2924031 RepID=UPI0020D0F122|nr:DUF2268 domain-containing putative Zn-dependent protease [Salipaludibacillus sp. LMS25]UTR15362.1 DUF2268 domain-containing protein [Salipaludibacillus sp. LMS25]